MSSPLTMPTFQTRLLVGSLSAIAFVLLPSPGSHTSAQQPATAKVDFEGPWDGKFKDNESRSGEGKYRFHQEKNGRWDVTVSWDRDTKSMQLKGERLGPDAVRLQGRYEDTTYWYVGRMEGSTLVLRYLSVDAKSGKSGSGVSTLTRAK